MPEYFTESQEEEAEEALFLYNSRSIAAIHPRHDQVFVPSSNEIINHRKDIAVVAELLLHTSSIEDQLAGIASSTLNSNVLCGLCAISCDCHQIASEYCGVEGRDRASNHGGSLFAIRSFADIDQCLVFPCRDFHVADGRYTDLRIGY